MKNKKKSTMVTTRGGRSRAVPYVVLRTFRLWVIYRGRPFPAGITLLPLSRAKEMPSLSPCVYMCRCLQVCMRESARECVCVCEGEGREIRQGEAETERTRERHEKVDVAWSSRALGR
jgi:hypothetical protein